ncbi:MAG: hypothetical protein QM758_30100 [Armatimonas sp.]
MNPIVEQLDTAALAHDGLPTKALVVINEREGAFHGVGQLVVDFRIREALPITVFSPQGDVVPSRLVDEILGPPEEADGKRRWQFTLEFFCDAPPRSAIAYGAVFTDSVGSHASGRQWASRHLGGVLAATETECRAGALPNPCAL